MLMVLMFALMFAPVFDGFVRKNTFFKFSLRIFMVGHRRRGGAVGQKVGVVRVLGAKRTAKVGQNLYKNKLVCGWFLQRIGTKML